MARNAVRKADRDHDDVIDRDWLDWWFIRAFGKTEFTFEEIILDLRTFRAQLVLTMTAYFEYAYDQELSRHRETVVDREDNAALAEQWVAVQIENIILAARDAGDDVRKLTINFDTKANRIEDGRAGATLEGGR